MMGVQLTLDKILERAVDLFPERELVTKLPDGSTHRYTYGDAYERICQLAHALDEMGLEEGARVGVVATNHYRHFELYFGPACSARSIHMCNMRLPDHHFVHTIEDAEDEVIFVDPALVEKVEANADELETVKQYVILCEEDELPETDLEPVVAYESLLAGHPTEYEWPDIDEDREYGMCHTSGTTGLPKGVPYTHRAMYLHSIMCGHVDANQVSEGDVALPVVPMFHANGWGIPYAATFAGAKQVFPSVHTDPESLAHLIDDEEVTVSAAVPTIWLEMANYLDENPDVDISNIDRLTVGGSAPPESLIRKYDEEYDAPIIQGWGMTETSPLGTLSTLRTEVEALSPEEQYEYRTMAGFPVPGMQVRIIDDDGEEVPRDGETMGELEVRSPWVTDHYHNRPEENEQAFTDDGYLRTGDIAVRDELGYVDVVDRDKDVIKSGGEWISSVQLENDLIAHEDVAEATVVGVEHERWQERPLAIVVPTADADLVADDLADHLGETFPDWWLPDAYEFIDEIPKTSTGKFDKKRLRDRFDIVLEATDEEEAEL
ncbi:long-chain fatty acid--CoA ligase [Natronorubrum daqingense]|uniref:Fatty-acid--CoA ligase n=1 Tax=Natronorubrum daqingense TaxID=588898 RepID=A0A1N7CJ97_9EURY|nr:long-chain fatty acid--CoA ligase [Natronorubrum daqingense]APX96931.1 fatty-acid--CoA ligase [Natronorubrum daqingense]SIR63630.1 fatty-acyl-CoA synthase [Natronorubrum daqingense]